MSSPVIQIENLSKRYRLGVIGYGSLHSDLRSFWAKVRGKEDPNSVVGTDGKLGRKGDFWALQNIDLEVGQGDRVGIVGRNGAGKSTLLKILSKITAPTQGKVRIKGRIASLLEVGTGFHPELTGRENVYLNGAILGMRRREIQTKFDEIIEFAGVSEFVDTPVKRYSSGMYVRLAFSVAAHLDSDILIIDEVLAVGDAEFQKKCLGKMENISKQSGKTILFVSHQISMVKTLCNVGVYLADGQIKRSGPMDQVMDAYFDASKDSNASVIVNSRFGTAEFLVESIEVAEAFDDGEHYLDFSVHLSANVVGRSCLFELDIDDKNGNRLFFLITPKMAFKKNKLDFRLKNCLLPGSYYLTHCLKIDDVISDYIRTSTTFETTANADLAEKNGSSIINSMVCPEYSLTFR